MKIVHLIDSGGMYGAEQMVINLAAGQFARGHEAILASSGGARQVERPIDVTARERGIEVWSVSGIRRFLARARSVGVDVIHSHGYKAHILMALFGGGPGAPLNVATMHGWTSIGPSSRVWWYVQLERQLLHRFDALVAVHAESANTHKLPARARHRITVINNGLPLRPVASAPDGPGLQQLRDFCSAGPTIGVVARLSAEKGVAVLLDALAILRDQGRRTRLAVVGDGPLRASLEQQAIRLRLAERVYFAGYVRDAGSVMPLFSVLALPSYQEGLPIALLEAMRESVPVVASRVGGVGDALDQGACGRLVPPGDAQALARALAVALDDRYAAQKLADLARERFSTHFSVDTMVGKYIECYERAASARRAPSP